MTVGSRRRILPRRSIMLLIASTFFVSACVVSVLVCSIPKPYRPLSPSDTSSERARIFERSFISEVTRIRASEAEWGIRLREDDLNAWLWLRLPQWLSHVSDAGEVDLSPVQSMLQSDRILITSPQGVLAFEPRITVDGLSIQPRPGGSVGRLPVSSSLVMFFSDGFDFSRMLASFGSLESTGEALSCRFELGDGRVVELLETRLDDGAMVLVFRTLQSDLTEEI